jgi:hypothetical protein
MGMDERGQSRGEILLFIGTFVLLVFLIFHYAVCPELLPGTPLC